MPLNRDCAVDGCENRASVRLIATSLDFDRTLRVDACEDHIDYLETVWKETNALNSLAVETP